MPPADFREIVGVDDVLAAHRLGAYESSAWARVDDTGVGIDEADLPKVFDVAYRWPATEVTARACILGGGAAARAIGDARERKSAAK